MNAALSLPPVNVNMEPWVSATQISTFELCNRKWAWRWLERVYAPPSKFAQLGVDTHGKLDKWLKWSVVPAPETRHKDDEHRKRDEHAVKLAHALIPYLPPPQAVEPTNVEREELLIIEDVIFVIKVDLFMPSLVSWDGQVRHRTYDHKTSKDPAKWAPTQQTIQYDAQAALYAAWAMVHTETHEVDLQWNFAKTVGAVKVEPVYATVTEEMIMPRLLANLNTGRQIKAHIAQTKRALDVVADARACDEYGGCPYKDRCGITAKERIVSVMSDFKNQPATQQFLAGMGPGSNGQAVNPPAQFQPPGQFQAPGGQPGQFSPPQQFQPPQQPGQFSAPQQPQFQPPQQPGQFSAPMPTQQPGQFSAPMPAQQPGQFSAPMPAQQPQFAPQQPQPQQFQTPPTQQQFQAPPAQQQQFAPPPAQQQFAPPAPAPQPQQQFQQQFAPPPIQQQQPIQHAQQAAAPAADKGPGRPKQPKEYDLTGAWAVLMSGAIVVAGGNTSTAAQLADQMLMELKARQ